MTAAWTVRIPVEKAPNRAAAASDRPRVVVGLDPGSEGYCVALSLVNDRAMLWPIPSLKVDGVPVVDLREIARSFKVSPLAFAERTMGRGGWGATQNFNFGAYSGGAVSAMVNLGWTVRAVTPQEWQKAVHRTASKDPKVRSLDAYRRLFPHDPLPRTRRGKINDNALDALLIAVYGAATLGYEPRRWTF